MTASASLHSAITAALILAVGGLGWELNKDEYVIRHLDDTIRAESTRPHQQNEEKILECSRASERYYHDLGYGPKAGGDRQTVTEFRNHYNSKAGKCGFYLMGQTYGKDSLMDERTLIDLYDHKPIAEYVSMTYFDNKTLPKLPQCVLRLSQGRETRCNAEVEFTEAVNGFLSE